MISSPAPTTVAEAARQACARLVLERVQVHPWLDPIRAAGHQVVVSSHEGAIWLSAVHKGAGQYELEARLDIPEWWAGKRVAKEDWARVMANALVGEMVRQWVARPGSDD
jgi:hypothetical protein